MDSREDAEGLLVMGESGRPIIRFSGSFTHKPPPGVARRDRRLVKEMLDQVFATDRGAQLLAELEKKQEAGGLPKPIPIRLKYAGDTYRFGLSVHLANYNPGRIMRAGDGSEYATQHDVRSLLAHELGHLASGGDDAFDYIIRFYEGPVEKQLRIPFRYRYKPAAPPVDASHREKGNYQRAGGKW